MDSTSATGPSPSPTPSRRIPKASGTAQLPSGSWQPRTHSLRQIGPTSCSPTLLRLRLSPPLWSPLWDLASPLQASHPQDLFPRRCHLLEQCLLVCLLLCHRRLCHLELEPPAPPLGLHPLEGTHLTHTPSHRAACTTQECLPCKCTTARPGWASTTQDHQALEASPLPAPRPACRTPAPHPWVCHQEGLILGHLWVTPAPCRTTGCAALLH